MLRTILRLRLVATSSHHILALESDIGVFGPYGIEFTSDRSITDTKDDGIMDLLESMRAAGKYLGYPGTGRHVPSEGWGPAIQSLCDRSVTCAHSTPAALFPSPHSTSPYAIKDAVIRDDNMDRKGTQDKLQTK